MKKHDIVESIFIVSLEVFPVVIEMNPSMEDEILYLMIVFIIIFGKFSQKLLIQ
jgi:hypothetical protein